jgi:NADH-quinone oxidoreductase subunit L
METIILFAPLVGALIAGFGWRIIGDRRAMGGDGLLFLPPSCQLDRVPGASTARPIHPRSCAGSKAARWTDWAIRLDRLTAIMLIVVTTVSALVHLYSFGYMAHDAISTREGESYRPGSSPTCRSSPSPC